MQLKNGAAGLSPALRLCAFAAMLGITSRPVISRQGVTPCGRMLTREVLDGFIHCFQSTL